MLEKPSRAASCPCWSMSCRSGTSDALLCHMHRLLVFIVMSSCLVVVPHVMLTVLPLSRISATCCLVPCDYYAMSLLSFSVFRVCKKTHLMCVLCCSLSCFGSCCHFLPGASFILCLAVQVCSTVWKEQVKWRPRSHFTYSSPFHACRTCLPLFFG